MPAAATRPLPTALLEPQTDNACQLATPSRGFRMPGNRLQIVIARSGSDEAIHNLDTLSGLDCFPLRFRSRSQ
ncbi:hypothetical protein DF3PA_200060 [Candidatus Defluviicoccus seviourii]|uniref:Uncharacterized protein n=1 Tax=Candidatus Defluviicoccus seviourii TaxID=2565273 RepID=A0A564WEH2_9PROT|nr:hypothetical protein DF3PA_200060 [Candidatus Defluviicoccus seviourii]